MENTEPNYDGEAERHRKRAKRAGYVLGGFIVAGAATPLAYAVYSELNHAEQAKAEEETSTPESSGQLDPVAKAAFIAGGVAMILIARRANRPLAPAPALESFPLTQDEIDRFAAISEGYFTSTAPEA